MLYLLAKCLAICCMGWYNVVGKSGQRRFFTLFYIQGVFRRCPLDRKEGGMKMVTYSDLIQTCILLVTLVGLCYQVFHGRGKKK